jgi:bacillithiol biosynthesis deacetylase BshB1
MEDGFFQVDKAHQLSIISVIRKYRPEIIISNAVSDRHPDHPRAAALLNRCVFLAGLSKVSTTSAGQLQEPWRIRAHYHYIQDRHIRPDITIDISSVWDKKMAAIRAYRTQFYDPASNEPETPISGRDFIDFLEARAIEFGRPLGVRYGEGFSCDRTPGVSSLFDLK